jgi:hypothetical protein
MWIGKGSRRSVSACLMHACRTETDQGLVSRTLRLQLYKLNEMNLPSNAPSTETEKDMLAAVITSTIATKTVAG